MTADTNDPPSAVEDEAAPRRRFARVRIAALILTLLLLALLIVAWIERKTIVSDLIDRKLTASGVPARYAIANLGFSRQRLTNVVIGDPAAPDLVADWLELRTHVGLTGPVIDGVRAGHVRLRARLVDGKLSLGALDRLLPASSGKPFALPEWSADIADARIRLELPQGVVGMKLSGAGKLNDGFRGDLAAVSDRLDIGGCGIAKLTAAVAIRIVAARPTIDGPVRLGALDCGAAQARGVGADVSATGSAALDQWQGSAKLAVATLRHPAAQVDALAGTVTATGGATGFAGKVDLKSGRFGSSALNGDALALAGEYRVAGTAMTFDRGRISAGGAHLTPAQLRALGGFGAAAAGTPAGPLAEKLARAIVAAGQGFDLDADVSAARMAGALSAVVRRAALQSRSGARVSLSDGADLRYTAVRGVKMTGTIVMAGGDLPQASLRLTQSAPGQPIAGTATVQPYAAGSARLALAPVAFRATPGGNLRFTTQATLSGPLGDGRLDTLTLPIDGLWDGKTRFVANTDCTPIGFDRLAVSGLVLRAARLRLCPIGGGLVSIDGHRLSGGARLSATRLTGALGSSPIALVASGAEVRLADSGFSLAGLGVRIGAPDRLTRLDFQALDGRFANGAIAGAFSGGGGQIGNVPLLLTSAVGTWGLRGGALDVHGGLTVGDAAAPARFKPLTGKEVVLTLVNNRITATGALVSPIKGVSVANVAILHDLASGAGKADLAVPNLVFDKSFQPDDLTPLTFGVIANVAGTVSGEGHIRWTADGVASDGVFRTAATDLAAAFGPVTGIAGEVRFTDLLALETAPGQIATVKTINPGISVNDGTIRYRLLANTRVQVEDGRWPFAGGDLVLEPTLLDFAQARERRMTFRVTGMDAGQFLQQFDFKNLNATGIFDGVLPMIFDDGGGRIENGRLTVRQGGGTLAYVGEVSQKDVGFWGNLAFNALKSLRYRNLDLVLNGPLAGEMVTEVRFAGIGQGKGAKRNFILDRLQKLPFVFNVRIKAPFRQLVDSAQSFYDPKRLIERNLPALIEDQKKRAAPPAAGVAPPTPIQPPESRTMP